MATATFSPGKFQVAGDMVFRQGPDGLVGLTCFFITGINPEYYYEYVIVNKCGARLYDLTPNLYFEYRTGGGILPYSTKLYKFNLDCKPDPDSDCSIPDGVLRAECDEGKGADLQIYQDGIPYALAPIS
ncbi:7031_t:CDS:1 [Diversispora eburnea]|uniref:7031_t:CDS:1 n=1 Tax=Diversispora eburnea TaxID=1213867 RepID=A0A9N9FQ49_9GLOM|nr:7031_t:CDS:1 [Diversispora eburnea]